MSKNPKRTPGKGPTLWGRPERERRTPENIGDKPYCENGEGVANAPLPYPLVEFVRDETQRSRYFVAPTLG